MTELEEVKAKLDKSADTDASRKRFMASHRFKDGTTLEDAYQQSIRKRQEDTERMIENAMEMVAKYEAMQRGTGELGLAE